MEYAVTDRLEDANLNSSDEEVVRRFYHLMDTQQVDQLDSVLAPSLQFHLGAATLNRDEMKDMIRGFYTGFPDFTHNIDEIFSGGGRVVARATDTATHLGEFSGIPATNRRITVGQIAIYQIESGKIIEAWEQADVAGLMAQISTV